TGQFSYFFNLEGIVKYAAAICVVKCIHELSHAYTAKRYGLYVPSMGIAFIVLFPLLFTDVTNAWKLRSRHQRLLISAAGILAETILAGLSTIGWLLTEPGTLHNILFVVSSTTWVSTLAVNLNPVIRYDGYYILADLWGVDNLHQRAFRVAKWKLRDWLLGLKGDNPEPALPPRYIPGLVLFSLFTWFWRLSIFLAIAWIIYVRFTKAIGLLLIVFQMAVYIGWPIVSEVRAVFGMRQQFSWNPRALLTVSLLSIGLVWLVIPFPHSVSFSGVTSPSAEQVIYVPYHSTIKNVPALRGAQVKAGDLLIELDSVELSYQTHSLRAEIALLEQRIDQYALDEEKKALIPQVRAERASKLIRLQGLQEIKDRLTIEADQDGVVDMLAEGLRPGLQVRQDQVLAKISAPSALEVIFYVPARYIGDIQAGDAIRFETFPSKTSYQGKITSVNPVRETRLPYAALESRFGGDIATIAERDGKGLRLVDSYYPVRAELELGEEAFPRFGRTGTIEMRGPVRSILVDYITHTLALFWREGGF
ncbi:MAG: efflux RND transporter periplasmic adaptor subunit, partial [Chlamydiia bacterium]|nr:efflux RND transporter periplasmic adaptor subunit [Chlamydiia bacterium]